ncbi:MAG: hypothetical protein ACI8S6_000819 [Myxococcota bacterium]|jgi:hypothetical protein
MRYAAALITLSLTACGPNLIGDWVGTCEFNQYDVDVELEIKEDTKDGIAGDALAKLIFTDGSGGDPIFYEGELEGTYEKGDLEVDLDVVDPSGTNASFSIEAVYDKSKNEFEGECKSGGEDGDIELEFDG